MRLKQFLNIKTEANLEIDTSFTNNDKENFVAEIDYTQLEENLLIQQQQRVQEQNIKIAQSGRYPTLSLSGSIGSGYSGNNKELVGTEFLPKPFNIQVEENFYQTATLTLSIPIFNGNQVNSQIQLANIELDKSQLQQEKTILEIENKIEQLKIEIENANLIQSLSKPISEFSSGMQQRLKLILCCCYNAKVMLLDEPTSHLDSAGVEWYKDLLKRTSADRITLIASNNPIEYNDFAKKIINIGEG